MYRNQVLFVAAINGSSRAAACAVRVLTGYEGRRKSKEGQSKNDSCAEHCESGRNAWYEKCG